MKQLYKNKHWNIVEDYNINKILYLLIDRPTYINYNNEFIWKNKKGEWHREYDLPGHFNANNSIFWFKNNKFHRKNNKLVRIWISGVLVYK